MAVSFIACEIASELLKRLFEISAQIIQCKGTADNIIELIKNIQQMIVEIQTSGVEFSAHRQAQIRMILEILEKGKKLTDEVLKCNRWNVVRQVALVKKMEKLEKQVTSFFNGSILTNILADVHRLRAISEDRLDRVDKILEEIRTDVMRTNIPTKFDMYAGMDIFRDELEPFKRRMQMMMFEDQGGVFGITGMAGVGKTTLAREIERDNDFRCHFRNRILFYTVSQPPDYEEHKARIQRCFSLYEAVDSVSDFEFENTPKLLILDDVWSKEALDSLTSHKITGCTTLVVSRLKLTDPIHTYYVQLLNDDEAISLLCLCAFGQKSIPYGFCRNLVKQVANECKGLPLTLKTTGASLKNKPESYWEAALQRLSRGEPVDKTHEIASSSNGN